MSSKLSSLSKTRERVNAWLSMQTMLEMELLEWDLAVAQIVIFISRTMALWFAAVRCKTNQAMIVSRLILEMIPQKALHFLLKVKIVVMEVLLNLLRCGLTTRTWLLLMSTLIGALVLRKVMEMVQMATLPCTGETNQQWILYNSGSDNIYVW